MNSESSTRITSRMSAKYSVHVIIDRCKECGLCISICPVKVLVKSQTPNKYGYYPPEPAYMDKCIGCRLCEYNCPDFAIFVTAG